MCALRRHRLFLCFHVSVCVFYIYIEAILDMHHSEDILILVMMHAFSRHASRSKIGQCVLYAGIACFCVFTLAFVLYIEDILDMHSVGYGRVWRHENNINAGRVVQRCPSPLLMRVKSSVMKLALGPVSPEEARCPLPPRRHRLTLH